MRTPRLQRGVLQPHRWLSDPGTVMTAIRLALVYLVALVLQLTIFVEVRVVGVAPDLPALIAVLSSLLGGARRGLVMAFWAGLMWDVYLTTPMGLAAGAFTVVAYLLGSVTEDLFHDTLMQTALLAFVGTAAAVTLYALLGEVVGQHGMVDGDLVRIVAVSSALNAVVSLAGAPARRGARAIRREPRVARPSGFVADIMTR